MRIGLALEWDTDQYESALSTGLADFVEYGAHVAEGIAPWFKRVLSARPMPTHIHPLDVNLSGEAAPFVWLESLRALGQEVHAKALVADCGFWYLGHSEETWERPPDFGYSGVDAGRYASEIAQSCGIPFRLENPPVDWMPGKPDIWSWLDAISAFKDVELCLDLCHLLQFSDNVTGGKLCIPSSFPWHRVTEVHLGGVIYVEYKDHPVTLDQHLTSADKRQLNLLERILAAKGAPLDVCLEMEPQTPDLFLQSSRELRDRFGWKTSAIKDTQTGKPT